MIIPSFLGERNTVSGRAIPDNALVSSANIHIDDAGKLIRREGYVKSLSLTNVTAAYKTLGGVPYVVSDGILYRVLDDLTKVAIAETTATSFDDVGTILLTNDGLRVEGDKAISIKLATPIYPPGLALAEGSLPPGIYSACYAYVSPDGIESGSSPVATIELSDTGGISVDTGTIPDGYGVNIYLTEADGTVFYDNDGIPLVASRMLLDAMPETDIVAYHETMLWCCQPVEDNTVIWHSQPFYHWLFDLQKAHISIPGKVLAMKSVGGALLIGTDSAIYAYGDGLQLLAGYGVVPGNPITKTAEGTALIYTKRGICAYPPFTNLTEDKALFPIGGQCSTAVVDQGGIKKLVVLTDGTGEAFNVRA